MHYFNKKQKQKLIYSKYYYTVLIFSKKQEQKLIYKDEQACHAQTKEEHLNIAISANIVGNNQQKG